VTKKVVSVFVRFRAPLPGGFDHEYMSQGDGSSDRQVGPGMSYTEAMNGGSLLLCFLVVCQQAFV
jgi:hypothetical protein